MTQTKTRQSKGSVTRIKKSNAPKHQNAKIEPTASKPRSKSQKKVIDKGLPTENEKGLVKKIKIHPAQVAAEHGHQVKMIKMNSVALLPPVKDKSKVDFEEKNQK